MVLNIQINQPWAYGWLDSSTIVRNNIVRGKTKEPSGVPSCAPIALHVIHLFSNPLLYWLSYLGSWYFIDKGAIYSGKYWAKHERKTLRFIALEQFEKGISSCKLPTISYSSHCNKPIFAHIRRAADEIVLTYWAFF